MAPRRPLLLLLSAIALLATSSVLITGRVQAEAPNYVVDTTADLTFEPTTDLDTYCKVDTAGDCSLRQAIGEANRDGQASTISFDDGVFPSGSVGTITINGSLGELLINANDLLIDAAPPAPATDIVVRLDGNGADFPGLHITSSNVRVFGLSITGFSGQFTSEGAGVHIDGAAATNNLISNSRIGVLPDGATVAGNRYGVLITGGATSNQVRGSIIGGNTFAGVWIENSSTNTVASSGIGIGAGNQDLGNGEAGVVIISRSGGASSGNIVGSLTSQGDANTLSGNGPPSPPTPRAGILISGAGSTGNFVYANRVGLNLGGTAAVGNSGDGIRIENGASNNTILGGASTPIVVSGNTRYGINITGSGTAGNTISGNVFVGVNGTRSGAVGNGQGGIVVTGGATNTTITGSTVAGNSGGPGLLVSGAATTGTTLRTSFIGRFTSSGILRTLPNAVGVQIAGAGNTSVLTTTIGNNTSQGIIAQGTSPITVSGNTIVANTGDGVLLDGPRNLLVRTNTITGNLQSGLVLSGTLNAQITSNTITGHGQTGLALRGASGNTVLSNTLTLNTGGGLLLETLGVSPTISSALTGNTASGNGQFGIRLSEAMTTTLTRNYVGLSTARTATLANTGNGIELFNTVNTTLIDSFVAGNSGAGIVVSGANTLKTTINNSNVGFVQATISPFGFTVQAANTLEGLRISDGAQRTEVSGGVFGGAGANDTSPAGILIATSGVTVTGTTIGGVKETTGQVPPTLPRPFGPGIAVTGPLTDVQLLNNTLRFNKGPGIKVSGDAQAVRLFSNKLTGNGAGIDLVGTTLFPVGGPGSLTNPNHDIDPPLIDVATFSNPLRLQVGDQGIISGFVLTSTNQTADTLNPPSACNGCRIQLFAPLEGQADGQGWTVLGTRPVGDFASTPVTSFQTNNDGSYLRQVAGGIDAMGKQLLLVATDRFNNSSVFGVFPVSTGFTLTNLSGNQNASPGQTVTYTLRVSNTGTLDLNGLKLETSGTRPDWTLNSDPLAETIFSLPAGATRLVTVSLTLPTGSNANVKADLKDVTTARVIKDGTTLSQSVQLETTVLPAPVLVVTPPTSVGKARPTERVPHTHTIRNDGNVTVTVGLDSVTLDRTGQQTADWETTITPQSLTLAPGEGRTVRVDVLVPSGAQVDDAQGPVQAQTYVTATVPLSPTGGFGPVTKTFTDTTRVDLDPDAAFTDSDQELPGAAGQPVIFTHFVRNLSNSPARFCFIWSTSLGSTVTFEPRTDGFEIDANGCFDLDTTPLGRQAQFDAVVLVNERLLPGDREFVNISLRNVETGETIGSARVVDRVNVILGLLRPRMWLPLIGR